MERNLTFAIKIIETKNGHCRNINFFFFCEDFLLTKSRINVRTAHSACLLKVVHLRFLGVGVGWI